LKLSWCGLDGALEPMKPIFTTAPPDICLSPCRFKSDAGRNVS
jgi:hypothetical protein